MLTIARVMRQKVMMNKALITIVTAPKPFVDAHISTIQRNALRSWLALGDEVAVVVLGDDEGISANSKDLGIRHIPGVRCNEKGTPLISSMLELARKETDSPYLAIVNADIILFDDFLETVKLVGSRLDHFLLVGQRWDVEVTEELKTDKSFKTLKKTIQSSGRLHPPAGSDYFVFPGTCYQGIPDFAIGRAGWDNWFIYKSRFEGWKVVDGTHQVTIAHQDHDYRHLPGGQPHYRLPETRKNVTLGGGDHTIFTLFDAQYLIKDRRILRKPFSIKKMVREIEILPLTVFHSLFLGKIFYYLFHPRKGYAAIRSAFSGVDRKERDR
jgi:hypothetical protein